MKKLALALLLTTPAFAANLLTNPNFDTNVSGWTSSNGSILSAEWNGIDADGSTASGSVTLRNSTDFANGAGPVLQQCVPVTSGAGYDLYGKFQIPGNQDRTGSLQPVVFFYAGPNCSGDFLASNGSGGPFRPTGRFIAAGGKNIIAPTGAQSAAVGVQLIKDQTGGVWQASADQLFFGPTGGCVPNEFAMCLSNGRFRVSATYQTSTEFGAARAVQLTPDSGYLWFFGAENIELIVKVLNACGANSRIWVFSGGLTNVGVTLTVEDTVAKKTKTYSNALNQPFAPVQDTGAFNTCP